MFIRVDKKPLLDALLPALCAVSNKSTIAALSCVFLHADEENSTLTITGFDINKGLKTSIPATVLEGGNLLLEGHKFASIVRSLPDTEVSVQETLTRSPLPTLTALPLVHPFNKTAKRLASVA